jgi:hypothetical protein
MKGKKSFEIITLRYAREHNLHTYFTGVVCKNGHISERYTKSRRCSMCCTMWASKSYRINDGAKKAKNWRNSLSPEQKASIDLKAAERSRKWRKENPLHRNALTTLHKKAVKQRTPSWADIDLIKDFYRNCPPGHHVDHIYPLRGDCVSGLHVIENLQYLPAKENLRKNKRVLEEYI